VKIGIDKRRCGVEAGAVIVTGAGGAAGVAVIRALSHHRRVVGADCDPSAVGMHLAAESGLLPRAGDPDFVDQLAKLAQHTSATALVCTVAEEIPPLCAGAAQLAEAGLVTWLPPVDTVHACTDKWQFAQICRDHAIPAPATALGTTEGVPGPWIVKPRFGRGSRDVYAIDTVEELGWTLLRVPEPLVQTRLSGAEFTVDALVNPHGQLAGAVPRWRLETKAGISTKGRTFHCQPLVSQVARLLNILGLVGPANIQGFHTAAGEFAFTEVNPRFSGGLPLSLAAGADFVGEYLRGLEGLPVRTERLIAQPGVTMLRHLDEVFTR
jgi:carbamoyl-phosphate synthase large subunit